MKDKVLITGGHGLLGSYMTLNGDRPTHKELDITKDFKVKPYDLIVHMAAFTGVAEAEVKRKECWNVNVYGTFNLLESYPDIPFVYISTEYAKDSVNYYGHTKRMAEMLVEIHTAPFLIIRTLFKPTPWPFDKAFIDQKTQGDYVDVIAPMIDKVIEDWDRKGKNLIYVGTGTKTMFELAQRTRPDVKPNSIREMKVKLPTDWR